MAHVSLYRKYRSQTFAEVIGQDHITTTLANALSENRLHHAYLFTGPRGTGKTSTARILAKSVNCVDGPTPEPCNTCEQCVAITEGASVDVIEIDAASHGGVDDVRDLRDRVAFAPASARMKVYIVDECHMLSAQGWNAFLKTLEEPPSHVLFVFATTEPHKVLDTILSRTQRFDFKRIAGDQLVAHCERIAELEGLEVEPGALELVVRAGDGSARDTLSVLDQVIAFSGRQITVRGVTEVLGAVEHDLLAEAVDHIARGDVAGVCTLVGRLVDAGQDLRQFSRDAIEHLRSLLLLRVAPDAGLVDASADRLAVLRAQSQQLGQVELLRAIELLGEAQAQMRRGNTRLPLEVALIKAAMPEASGDAAALAARLDRLERRVGLDASAVPAGGSAEPARPTPAPAASAPAPAAGPAASTPAPSTAPKPSAAPPPPPDPVEPARAAAAPPEPAPPAQPKSQGTAIEPPAAADPQPAHAGGQAAAGPVDLDLVLRTWPAIEDAVKERSRRLHAFLTPARPVAVSSQTLTLGFGRTYAFHAEQCASEEWQEVLSSVFERLLGVPLRVRCTVSDGDDPSATVVEDPEEEAARAEEEEVLETEAAEAAGQLPGEQEAHDLAVETLTRDLGATVLEDGGR